MSAHPTDAALFAATPLLPAPRFGTLESLAAGSKRILGAADGVYVEARTHAWDVCARIAECPMPYGPLSARLRCPAGPIPSDLVREFIAVACANPDREVAAAIVLAAGNTRFDLIWPQIESSSSGHVRYIDADIDDDRLVLDLHSHAGHSAFFSTTDDLSDRSRKGPYLAAVVGRCNAPQPELAVRLVLSPYLIPLSIPDLKHMQVFQ